MGVGVGCLSATMHSSLLFLVGFFIVFTGLNTILPLVLNDALVGYENIIGTASGFFGFAYYVMISLMTNGMSLMHNGTAFALPFYVGALIVLMLILTVTCLRKKIAGKPVLTCTGFFYIKIIETIWKFSKPFRLCYFAFIQL